MQPIAWDEAPEDVLGRLIWIRDVLLPAVETAKADLYFDARLQGQLEDAVEIGLDSRKAVLAATRHANEQRGRIIRWGSV